MAWNGSGGAPQKSANQKSSSHRNYLWVVGIFAIGLIAAILFVFSNKNEATRSLPKETTRKIAEVQHHHSPAKSKEQPDADAVSLAAKVQAETGRIVHKARTTTNKYPRRVIQPRERPPKRFEHTSDELIAHLIETRPGATVVGHIPFERFEDDFRASIADPIKIKDEDSDYDKELKSAVSETRKEIAKLMGDGRSFGDIMQESRTELQTLAQYKYQLMDQLREIKKNLEITDDDYNTFVEAANKMLESKGIAPIKMPGLLYRQLKFHEQISEGNQE